MEDIKKLLSSFYSLLIVAHIAHVNTKTYSFHVATGEFYDTVNDTKDRLIEYLIGENLIKEVADLQINLKGDVVDVADGVANMLCGWAKNIKHEALINMAGEFEEKVGHLKYLSLFK
jgi:hypothetical protein